MHSTGALPPLVRGLAIGAAVIWAVFEVRQGANRRSEGINADRGSRVVLRVAIVVGIVGATAASRWAPGADISLTGAAGSIGLGLLWCGIALRLWCFRTLGRYFTFTVQTSGDQPVITAGPYRVVRHPSYAALLLAVVGLGIFTGNWLSLMILTAAIACALVYRIRVEERALMRDLGDEYRQYAATHKRLVPFVW